MTDLQQLLAVAGLPMVAVLVSETVRLFQISGIRKDIRQTRSDIKLLTGKVYETIAEKRNRTISSST